MTDYFEVDVIIEDAKYICPNKQWQIVFLGGNNLRRGHEAVDVFISKCQLLVEAFKKLPNAHLVFMGMIPSPETDEISKGLFNEANYKLKQLSQPGVSFCNLNHIFIKNGRIDQTMYSDGIHFNHKGSKNVATAIKNHLVQCEL